MSETALNRVVRIILILVFGVTILLLIVAAQPAARFGGSFLGEVNRAQPILNDLNIPAAYITITDPAVVSFPSEWNFADKICMVIRYQRGTASTALPFDEDLPQTHWDDRPDERLIITPRDIAAQSTDGTNFQIAPNGLYAMLEMRLPFRVRGFDQSILLLSKDQAVTRLLCYDFIGDGGARIPFVHVIRFGVQNAHVVHTPTFFFRFNSAPAPSDPVQADYLQKVSIELYLTKLKDEGSPVVEFMTVAQRVQRATESALASQNK